MLPTVRLIGMGVDDIRYTDTDQIEFENVFQKLDGIEFAVLEIVNTSGRLFVSQSQQGRVHAQFTGTETHHFGFAIDESAKESDEMVQMIGGGGGMIYDLYETVPTNVGIRIAEFFTNNDSLPSDTNWEGVVPQ